MRLLAAQTGRRLEEMNPQQIEAMLQTLEEDYEDLLQPPEDALLSPNDGASIKETDFPTSRMEQRLNEETWPTFVTAFKHVMRRIGITRVDTQRLIDGHREPDGRLNALIEDAVCAILVKEDKADFLYSLNQRKGSPVKALRDMRNNHNSKNASHTIRILRNIMAARAEGSSPAQVRRFSTQFGHLLSEFRDVSGTRLQHVVSVYMFLQALPEELDPVIEHLEFNNNLKELTLDQVQRQMILQLDQREARARNNGKSQAFYSAHHVQQQQQQQQNNNRPPKRRYQNAFPRGGGSGAQGGHGNNNRAHQPTHMATRADGQDFLDSDPCQACGRPGHTARSCKQRARTFCTNCLMPGHRTSLCSPRAQAFPMEWLPQHYRIKQRILEERGLTGAAGDNQGQGGEYGQARAGPRYTQGQNATHYAQHPNPPPFRQPPGLSNFNMAAEDQIINEVFSQFETSDGQTQSNNATTQPEGPPSHMSFLFATMTSTIAEAMINEGAIRPEAAKYLALVDTGANDVITPHLDALQDATSLGAGQHQIEGVGGLPIDAEAKGRAVFHTTTESGDPHAIKVGHALYSSKVKLTIVGLVALKEAGYQVDFRVPAEGDASVTSRDGARIPLTFYNGLWFLNLEKASPRSEANVTMTTATERTKGHDLLWWHNALGHVPFRAIMDIHREAREMKIDGDLDPAILEDCATCIRNNSKRKQVKKGLKPRPLYFLHYVGLDVIPETEVGIGGHKFTAFFSHHGYGSFFAVPMRTKRDLAKAYLKHRTYLGAPTILESDDEAIITKGDFSDLLLRENVLAKHTAPRNHRSNTVERYIQDYKRMYQALIDHAGLEQRLWPYAVTWASLLSFIRPTGPDRRTTFGRIYGRPPRLTTLPIFGCGVMYMRPDRGPTKTSEGIFLGFPFNGGHASAFIYDLASGRVVESCEYRVLHSFPRLSGPFRNKERVPSMLDNVGNDGALDEGEQVPDQDPGHITGATPLQEVTTVDGLADEGEPDSQSPTTSTPEQSDQDPESNSDHRSTKRTATAATNSKETTKTPNQRKKKRPTIATSDDSSDESDESSQDETTDKGKLPTLYRILKEVNRRDAKRKRQGGVPGGKGMKKSTTSSAFRAATISLKEIMRSQEGRAALQKEFNSLEAKDTWTATPNHLVPTGTENLHAFVTSTTKRSGVIKCRLVSNGKAQTMDSSETFSATATLESFRAVLTVACTNGFKLRQGDIPTAYLNAPIDRHVALFPPVGYILSKQQLEGLTQAGYVPEEDDLQGRPVRPGRHCKYKLVLNRALYGMKQSGQLWNKEFLKTLLNEYGLEKCAFDPCLFAARHQDGRIRLIVLIYVDDVLWCGDQGESDRFQRFLEDKYKLKVEDSVIDFLGIQIDQSPDGTSIRCTFETLIDKALERFGMIGANSPDTPAAPGVVLDAAPEGEETNAPEIPYMQLVGTLMYCCRLYPETAFAVMQLARFMSNYSGNHWKAAKRVLAYLASVKGRGTVFRPVQEKEILQAFSDADFAAHSSRRSVTGVSIKLGTNLLFFLSKTQKVTATSTADSELRALGATTKAIIVMRGIMEFLGRRQEAPTPTFVDNNAAWAIANTPGKLNGLVKHLAVTIAFIHDHVEAGTINPAKVDTKENIADLGTKPVSLDVFRRLSPALTGDA